MKCGDRLKILRTEENKTQEEIAKMLGMRQQHYNRYERNERDTPIDKILQLADMYKTSLDFIAGRTDIREPYPPAKGE